MLQAFRTLCREIARKRHDVEHLRSVLGTYLATRFNYFKTSILAAAPGVDVQGVSEKGNKLEEFAASSVAEGESDLQELEELYDELFQYVDSGSPEPCVQALNISPDIHLEIPVTLSGLGVLRYQDAARKKHRTLCLLGILPQGKTTLTFIAAARRHGDAIALCMRWKVGWCTARIIGLSGRPYGKPSRRRGAHASSKPSRTLITTLAMRRNFLFSTRRAGA